MKRWVIVVLCLCLALSGCSNGPSATATLDDVVNAILYGKETDTAKALLLQNAKDVQDSMLGYIISYYVSLNVMTLDDAYNVSKKLIEKSTDIIEYKITLDKSGEEYAELLLTLNIIDGKQFYDAYEWQYNEITDEEKQTTEQRTKASYQAYMAALDNLEKSPEELVIPVSMEQVYKKWQIVDIEGLSARLFGAIIGERGE